MHILKARNTIEKYQIVFNKVMAKLPRDLVNDDALYNKLVEIIKFLRDHSGGIKDNLNKNVDKLIFLVGATGSGKSTLINYLEFGDSLFVVSNDKGEIQLKNPKLAISVIGTGEKSTTLIPKIWNIRGIDGSFVDAPGEGDTTGVLAEIINSIMMTKITAKVQAIKIILVAKQSSLDSGGGYGAVFKEALDKNVQFFNNINKFKNSIGIVVTAAGVKASSLSTAKKDLHNILNHTGFQHKNLIKYLVDKSKTMNNIQTFSKASESLEIGESYSPRSDQCQKIKVMIQNLPFSTVPNKNYFHISSSPSSREAMSKVLDVIKMKGGQMLNKAIMEVCPLKIYALEITPFLKYLSGFIQGYKSDLMKYVAILQYNNYFELKSLDNEKIKKMDIDIKFISSYVHNSSDKIYHDYDWSEIAKVKDKFFVMHKDLKEINESPEPNFMKFIKKENITTKPAHHSSYSIKEMIAELAILCQNRNKLEALGKDQTSEYYKESNQQVFSHNKTEEYTTQIPYQEQAIIGKEEYTDFDIETERRAPVVVDFITLGLFGERDKIVPVTRTRDKYGLKNKLRDIKQTKEVPVYTDKKMLDFDPKLFNESMKRVKEEISSQEKKIEDKISQISVCDKIEKFMHENYSFKGEDASILLQLQQGEVGHYGLECPHNSLEEVGLDVI